MSETYTRPAIRVCLAICGGVAGVTAGAGLMGLFFEETSLETAGEVLVAALALTGIWRGANVRVVVTDSNEVVVRNLFRSYRVPWSDVVRVKTCKLLLVSGRQDFFLPCLVRRDRGPVKLMAMLDLGDGRFADVVAAWKRGRR